MILVIVIVLVILIVMIITIAAPPWSARLAPAKQHSCTGLNPKL